MHYAPSLEGIIAGETSISDVNGAAGTLTYRGTAIDQLTATPVLEVALRLCLGEDTAAHKPDFEAFMLAQAEISEPARRVLKSLPATLHPMLMLQSMMPVLESQPRPLSFAHQADDLAHGYALAAMIPSLLCHWRRHELGLSDVALSWNQDPIAGFLANFPQARQDAVAHDALNAAQVLQLEHSFNAGTFAGRVCASTEAPVESVLTTSIATLFGRLHGGADQAALEMARAVSSPSAAAEFVANALQHKQKIMGMGHREYTTVDPRARVLKPMAAMLCQEEPTATLFATLCAIEDSCRAEFAKRGKDIWANVEFYKGAVFAALGLPDHYFTAMFAMARVYGYVAHYEEFKHAPRLIRPQARYKGK